MTRMIHNSIDPQWHPLVNSVNDALEDYPHVPRVQISRFELERVLFGRYGAENPEAWAGVKHLIDSYAYLTLRAVYEPAAYIVVFNNGIVTNEALQFAAENARWIEMHSHFVVAMNKAKCEAGPDDIFTAEWSMKFLDRMMMRAKSPATVKAANKLRESVKRTLEKRTGSEYDSLIRMLTKSV